MRSGAATQALRTLLRRGGELLHLLESAVLIGLLLTIGALSAADIVMRNLFDTGIGWAPPLVRILVLWLALLGAAYATRANRHISIDVLTRLLSTRVEAIARGVTSMFAAAVCAVVCWHGVRFVHGSYVYADTVLNDVPAWLVQAVIPIGFALIGLRFALHGAGYLLLRGYQPPGGTRA